MCVIRVEGLCKDYNLYENKNDRLKEAFSITRKKYHEVHHALKDINFEVERGETVGIVGTNGRGKSTVLKILTGVIAKSKGNVIVDGKISALLELGAGFNKNYTGIQNIYLSGTMMGYSHSEMDERIDAIIAFADIGDFVYQPVRSYSSGMFARLAFAVAINVEPDILIVDEALSVGDVFFQNKCYKKFDELRAKGVTILFVSHDIESVKQMCTRVLWIEKGKQRMFGSAKEVCNAYSSSILGKNNEMAEVDGVSNFTYSVKRINEMAFPRILSFGNESILNENIKIISFFTTDEYGKITNNLTGGKAIEISVVFESYIEYTNLIVGIVLQNKKGQVIINTNSLINGEKGTFNTSSNSINKITFAFEMPFLASDEYILDCAVAQGTGVNDSKMLTWLYGAQRVFVENPLGNLGMLDVCADVSYESGKL